MSSPQGRNALEEHGTELLKTCGIQVGSLLSAQIIEIFILIGS